MNKTSVFLGFVLIGLVVVSLTSVSLKAAIPAEEREALIALYNATNGDNWSDNSGWKAPPLHSDGFAMPGTENNWAGITIWENNVLRIRLTSKRLVGSIPPELGNLSNLHRLILSYNQLRGSIPRELGNLRYLSDLKLDQNQLSGGIPPELGNLSYLRYLILDQNQLSGSIPPELGKLGNLQCLHLYYNHLSGSIPPELGKLRNLRHFYLYHNQLSGSIPPELGNLSNLTGLNLQENQLSGSIPPELENLSKLSTLNLNSNQLSGSIPPELGNLSNLYTLDLNSNQLSGGIPPELGNLSGVRYLLLHKNQLCDSIPPELGNLSNLYKLDLHSNQLSGSIPPELENLSKLGYLLLNKNQLCGSIPPEMGNLINLGELSLSNNQLSGSIPSELGNFINLRYLELDHNHLSGNIPTSLTNLTSLLRLSIENNCLYTDDPDLITLLNKLNPGWESTQCVGEINPPFGSFDTPIHGSTVYSSIPVTGWALDDYGIDRVKIYRKQGKTMVYIGDGVFVEGARPDVAAAYPDYPNNTKAGWGYMMLTNFLPNSGNGTFEIHAVVTDFAGKTTTLGTKTIHCDNANAVKPFGAIDTPTQGGTASGSSFINWGWVLTPPPNHIATDGSTINVYVDGVNLGHPNYNIYRSDIAALFPGYANSNGAVGYFYLDTTAYANGVHTIQWTARDSGGNSDGIGSRYFSISNTGTSALNTKSYQVKTRPQTPILNSSKLAQIPVDYSVPVRVKRGFKEVTKPEFIHGDETGMNRIDIKEVERLQIYLTDGFDDNSTAKSLGPDSLIGYQEVNNRLEVLPVGSTLDTQRGIFYWQPGPGFIGEYRFVFIKKEQNTYISRKNIVVKIVPRFQ